MHKLKFKNNRTVTTAQLEVAGLTNIKTQTEYLTIQLILQLQRCKTFQKTNGTQWGQNTILFTSKCRFN